MKKSKWIDLQLFGGEGATGSATGAGTDGNSGGESTGVNATAAAEQRLRELGVPEERIRKRASKLANKLGTISTAVSQPVESTDVESAPPAEEIPVTEEKKEAPVRMSWDEIMNDPEYNEKMQEMMSKRLKTAKAAEENYNKLTPVIEALAERYGLDPKNMDYAKLQQSIKDDEEYYENKAIEMNTSVDIAKRIDKLEKEKARAEEEANKTIQQQKYRDHLIQLENQAKDLQKIYPNFDLKKELNNPVFARMTGPNIGISVADAYYAVHRNELQSASVQVAVQKTTEQISNAIQANGRRPSEAGITSQAPSVSTFDYRTASKEQREALKKRIRDAAARGEKVLPGQY
jgi:hypothetical protein